MKRIAVLIAAFGMLGASRLLVAQPISVEHEAEKQYDSHIEKHGTPPGSEEPIAVPVTGTYQVYLPQPKVSGFVPDGEPESPAQGSRQPAPAPRPSPQETIRDAAAATGATFPEPREADDDEPPPPVAVTIKGPSSIRPDAFAVAAIVTAPEDAKLEWQIQPDPGREHREVGKLGPGKWLLLFIEPPEGEYTIVAVAKIVNPGEDGIGLAWMETTVGGGTPPVPPVPDVLDTDGDGLPDTTDPCPKDPHNICNDPVPPEPGPVQFDSAVVVVEKTAMTPEHALLLNDLPFWRTLTGNKFRFYDPQQPEVAAKGYDRLMSDAGVQPPALILLKVDGTPAKVGPLPDTEDAVKAFAGK